MTRRGGLLHLLHEPTTKYRDKAILLDINYADPLLIGWVHLCEDAALTMADQLALPPRHASANTSLVRGKCPSTTGATICPPFAVNNFGGLGKVGSRSSQIT